MPCREAIGHVAALISRLVIYTAANGIQQLFSSGLCTSHNASPDKAAHAVAENIIDIAVYQADADSLRDKLQMLDPHGHDSELIAGVAEFLSLLAAQHGTADIIPVLAEHGATFQTTDKHRGASPLMHAAHNGHSAAVAALLKVRSDSTAIQGLSCSVTMSSPAHCFRGCCRHMQIQKSGT